MQSTAQPATVLPVGKAQCETAVLIPAYRPNHTLPEVVTALAARGMASIIVIDDGSGPGFRAVFDEAARIPGVQILRHAINLGKGAALKTAFNYVLTSLPDVTGVVTADADGQHDPDDIVRVCQRFAETPDASDSRCARLCGGCAVAQPIWKQRDSPCDESCAG